MNSKKMRTGAKTAHVHLLGRTCAAGLILSSLFCSLVLAGPILLSYDAANHLVQATNASGDSVQFQYDANGNAYAANGVSTSALALGTSQTVSFGSPGSNAVLSFTAASGGPPLAIVVGAMTTTPANSPVTVNLYNSSGALVSSTSATAGRVLNYSQLAAGNYTVVLVPANAASGSVQVTLKNYKQLVMAAIQAVEALLLH